ncbi:MAG: LPS assembly lipoprotein LptE [Acetobacteraceae bacterium]
MAGLAAAPLGGCGFQPVYMPTASGAPGPAERELAAIDVALIPDRPGQLLRQALQQRFQGAGDPTPRRYTLSVTYWIAGQGIGILPGTTATRIRMIGNANWVLTDNGPARTRIASGYARAIDAVNIFDQQYFAADLETSTVYHRLAGALADQITLRLASLFRARAQARVAG